MSTPQPDPAPLLAGQIPNANTPVRLPEVRKARASLIANIVVGGVLAAVCIGGIVAYYAMGLAS